MQTFKRPLPTSTVSQSRLRLFQPTRRPVKVEDTIKTAWGVIRIKGRIGQAHADVLEAMFTCAERHVELPDGRIKLLVDPWLVKQKADQLSGTTMQRILDDLMQVIIEIKEPVEMACLGHLIDHVTFAQKSDGTKITRDNPLGGQRDLWTVKIGEAACMLIAKDLKLWHDPSIVARMSHGITQAVARHVLTHSRQPSGGWSLDGLICTVCGEVNSVAMRHRRNEIRSDAQELEKLGIIIDGDKVKRQEKEAKACSIS